MEHCNRTKLVHLFAAALLTHETVQLSEDRTWRNAAEQPHSGARTTMEVTNADYEFDLVVRNRIA